MLQRYNKQKRSWQDLEQHSEVTLELKKTIATHEEVQYKKKVPNKQVHRLETTLGWMRLLKRYHQEKVPYNKRGFLSYLKVHHVEYKVEELLIEEQMHLRI